MNYIGSKLRLLGFLENSINKVVDKNCRVFCDIFAGTGIVGTYFKKKGYSIISNDIQYYSYVLNRHYVENNTSFGFSGLEQIIFSSNITQGPSRELIVCDFLSNIKGTKGFIYENYCLGGTKNKEFERIYFSDENAMKCDAIRQKIEEWRTDSKINDDEYFFLLASLLESVDKYANTASVYGAFLKEIKKSALKPLVVKPANLIINSQKYKVFNEDVNKLVEKISGDILYLDPPYNQRQYATNYHLLETVARYDNPNIYGKTGLRDYEQQKSLYCSRPQVKKVFNDLIQNAKFKYIFLSYNNEGLMTHDDIKEIMSKRGRYGYFTQEYGRFKADKTESRNHKANKTLEYLHYVIIE